MNRNGRGFSLGMEPGLKPLNVHTIFHRAEARCSHRYSPDAPTGLQPRCSHRYSPGASTVTAPVLPLVTIAARSPIDQAMRKAATQKSVKLVLMSISPANLIATFLAPAVRLFKRHRPR